MQEVSGLQELGPEEVLAPVDLVVGGERLRDEVVVAAHDLRFPTEKKQLLIIKKFERFLRIFYKILTFKL